MYNRRISTLTKWETKARKCQRDQWAKECTRPHKMATEEAERSSPGDLLVYKHISHISNTIHMTQNIWNRIGGSPKLRSPGSLAHSLTHSQLCLPHTLQIFLLVSVLHPLPPWCPLSACVLRSQFSILFSSLATSAPWVMSSPDPQQYVPSVPRWHQNICP